MRIIIAKYMHVILHIIYESCGADVHTIDNCIALPFREQPHMKTKKEVQFVYFFLLRGLVNHSNYAYPGRSPIFYENYELIAYGIWYH